MVGGVRGPVAKVNVSPVKFSYAFLYVAKELTSGCAIDTSTWSEPLGYVAAVVGSPLARKPPPQINSVAGAPSEENVVLLKFSIVSKLNV